MTLAVRASFLALGLALLAPRIAAAQMIPLDTGFQPPARNVQGMSGGPFPAQNVDASCRGYIAGQPQHTLMTRTGFGFLRVFVQSQGDTTLVVRGANGMVYCNDDHYGLNPGLDLTSLPPGRYDIFVGSYSAGSVSPYALWMSENSAFTPDTIGQMGTATQMQGGPANTGNPPPNNGIQPNTGAGWGVRPGNTGPAVPPPAASGLHSDMPPLFGRIAIRGAMRRAEVRTARISNATVPATSVQGTGTCRGWIAQAPSFIVTMDRPQPFMRFFLNSAADTTMVVQYPDGHAACSDDSFGGLQPAIDGMFPAGTYYVWAGIYQSGMERPFRLTITSDSASHP